MNDIDKIIELSKNDSSFLFYRKYLKNDESLKKHVDDAIVNNPWFETERLYMICVSRGILNPVKCRCGNSIKVRNALKGKRFCSCACSNGDEDKKEKERETNRRKYGCDYSTQSNEINKKRRNTMIERYGVAVPLQSDDIREKAKATVRIRYGVDNVMQNNEIKERLCATNIERYGCEHAIQNDDVRAKAIGTTLLHYGVENPSQSDIVRKRVIDTNIERYGVENAMMLESVQEKVRNTNFERYGAENYVLSDDYRKKSFKLLEKFSSEVIPMFDWTEWKGWNSNIVYDWKCVKCGNEFKSGIHCFELNGIKMPRCLCCYPLLGNGSSHFENEVLDFVQSVTDKKIIHGDRTVLYPLELDIYIPELSIAIECDGLYWHSEKCGKDSTYHLSKTEQCNNKGIRLIHIFEDEWKFCSKIVEDRIRSILGIGQERIFARNCDVIEIDKELCNDFLEENHLQGGDGSSIRYGLFCNDELVSVMTFGKPRFNKNYDWELIRFASRCGCNVIGGASKLLSYFRKQHSGSIVSYADRRYSDGNLYEKIGFKLNGVSEPNYWYVKGEEKLSRYQCQKHKLPALLGDGFDENLSETENMVLNGWMKVFDCGNLVYVLE